MQTQEFLWEMFLLQPVRIIVMKILERAYSVSFLDEGDNQHKNSHNCFHMYTSLKF